MKLSLKVLTASLAVCPTVTATAVDYYAGGGLAYLYMPIASASFGGAAVKLRAGATLPSGWGAEVQTLFGVSDETVGGLTLKADNVTAGFVRYETAQGENFRFFAAAGYATTSLSYDGTDTGGLDNRFSGFAWGLGAQERLKRFPNTTAVLEFNNYYSDSNLDVWSVSFGVRYDF